VSSPRKFLRRAQEAFAQLDELLERVPAAGAALAGQLGPARVADLERARRAIDNALAALDAAPDSPGEPLRPEGGVDRAVPRSTDRRTERG
jgi:hypothetical protein